MTREKNVPFYTVKCIHDSRKNKGGIKLLLKDAAEVLYSEVLKPALQDPEIKLFVF